MDAKHWIEKLQLLPHPEGGYYKETYRCAAETVFDGFDGKRSVSTAIYFLLEREHKSHFHRIQSDELWFFHEGVSLEIFCLSEKGLTTVLLGKKIEAGEQLQAIIPAGTWFGAKVRDGKGYALVSCTVAPGFDFRDFELGKKAALLEKFPREEKIIGELAYQ